VCCECYIDGGAYRLKLCCECYNPSFNLWRKVPESGAWSAEEKVSRCSVEGWRTSDRTNVTVSTVPATEGGGPVTVPTSRSLLYQQLRGGGAVTVSTKL